MTGQTSRSGATAADTPRTRVDYYRTVCHLLAVLQPEAGRIGFTAGMLWAVSMAADAVIKPQWQTVI
ncbi:hypothetical protein [Nocardia lijiangensis]|uniref:hypothetical protein n=1 Tax=Nocardia lijiangensis TaxID=299618 RepID=UPI000A913F5C|nr:hypothetical protein [Nocardia lijiangensis]